MDAATFFGLQGRVALVTGAGAGIGKACALLLGRLGVDVCLVDRDSTGAKATQDLLSSLGRRALVVIGDAREPAVAQAAVEKTMSTLGRIDILVNNAGGMFFAPASAITPGGWTAVVRLNLDSAFFFAQAAAVAMLKGDGGSIINIASVAGMAASPNAAHYGAAKAGLINLTRTLALEWAPRIRVNCIAPDFIMTEGTSRLMAETDRERISGLIPLGRLGQPEDVANIVAFLASPLASFITGETIVADGGASFRGRLDFVATGAQALSDHGDATAHAEHLPGDVRGVIGSQEQDR